MFYTINIHFRRLSTYLNHFFLKHNMIYSPIGWLSGEGLDPPKGSLILEVSTPWDHSPRPKNPNCGELAVCLVPRVGLPDQQIDSGRISRLAKKHYPN